MGREFSRVRAVGTVVLAVEVAVGTLLVVRHGPRLGSPGEAPGDLFPESVADTLVVIGVMAGVAVATLVAFGLAGRRWSRAGTDVHPATVVVVGGVLVASATGLAFQSQVVTFAPPPMSLADGRVLLDALVGDVLDPRPVASLATAGPPPPEDGPGPPTAAAMAASLVRTAEPCRDQAGRDTGARSLSWTYDAVAAVPADALARLRRRGNALVEPVLPPGYLDGLRVDVVRALTANGFDAEYVTGVRAVTVSGHRPAPGDAGGGAGGDAGAGSFTFATAVRLAGPARAGSVPVEASMTLRSPCLRPPGPG